VFFDASKLSHGTMPLKTWGMGYKQRVGSALTLKKQTMTAALRQGTAMERKREVDNKRLRDARAERRRTSGMPLQSAAAMCSQLEALCTLTSFIHYCTAPGRWPTHLVDSQDRLTRRRPCERGGPDSASASCGAVARKACTSKVSTLRNQHSGCGHLHRTPTATPGL
jgi:hypothetical protein